MNQHDFNKKKVAPLLGYTIIKILDDPEAESYGFVASMKGKPDLHVWIDMDEEGNGPGHIAVTSTKGKVIV